MKPPDHSGPPEKCKVNRVPRDHRRERVQDDTLTGGMAGLVCSTCDVIDHGENGAVGLKVRGGSI